MAPIHIWFVEPTQMIPAAPAEPPDFLTDHERRRWSQLQRPELRDRFLRRHLALRQLLGEWLGVSPKAVELAWEAGGKPLAEHRRDDQRLAISWASRHGHLLLAAAWGGSLGVDLEPLQPVDNLDLVASQALAPDELGQLRQRPESERLGAFLGLWTHKEAVLKASGAGLSLDPRRLSVLAATEPSRAGPLRIVDVSDESWYLAPLSLPSGWLGAVCHNRPIDRLQPHLWPQAAVTDESLAAS